jgi:hypothetical protein
MRNKGFLIMCFFMVYLIFTSGCGFIAWRDGPYKGKVIDAETGKPLEGVVVLGVWYKELSTPATTHTLRSMRYDYYHSKYTLGNFAMNSI